MAIVKFLDPVTKKEISYHMNSRLRDNLDDKVIPSLFKKDKDCFIVVDGREGCQPKGEKVLMADGSWKNVEDIKVGDSILSPDELGAYVYAKVINLFHFKAENIYDIHELHRQKKKLYSCSQNHFIPLNQKDNKTKQWKIVHYQAQDLFNKSNRDSHNTTTPTMFKVDKFKDVKNCEVEPYTLGVWLGDGHFLHQEAKIPNPKFNKDTIVKGHWRNFKSGKKVWQTEHKSDFKKIEYLNHLSRDIGITSNDLEIIEEVSKFYSISYIANKSRTTAKTYRFSLNGELSKLLNKYNLEGKGSGTKFIPKKALTSDLEYRKRLLAGLIDTDGTISKSCSYSITTKSEQLAKDIEFLVYSLGGRASIRKIKKGIKRINFIGEYFRVSFYLGDLELPLKIKRKRRDKNFFYLSANRTSVKLKKRDADFVYGFELDSKSHWYITNNYVVTRNSGKSTIALQIGKYVDRTLDLSRVVFDAESFRNAIFKAKKGQCIIFDEAFSGLSSRAALSGINKALVGLMMQMRQKNLFVIMVLPTFFMLDKYAAIFRAKALIHVYENKGIRGYFRLYNYKLKKILYLMGKKDYSYSHKFVRTRFTGRFYGKFALGGDKEEKEYRKKKEEALEATERNPMTTKQIRYRNQRDIVIYLLRKASKMTYREMETFLQDYDFDMSYSQIAKICGSFGDKEEKTGKLDTKLLVSDENLDVNDKKGEDLDENTPKTDDFD